MNKISLIKKLLLLFSVVFFASCDKEFNTIGADIVGENHFDLAKDSSVVVAYNKKTGAVQSNNLQVNSFGVYTNDPFGKTTAHFVSQLTLGNPNPTLGLNIEVDSVYLYVPYFSHVTKEEDGNRTYELDSIFRNKTDEADYNHAENKFGVEVYENGYHLNSDDPLTNEAYIYYSDNADVENRKLGTPLNDSPNTAQNTQFYFDNKEIKLYKKNEAGDYLDSGNEVTTDPTKYVVRERYAPGIWMDFNDKLFFKNKFLTAANVGYLFNNQTFKDYFKGLYFKVTNPTVNGKGAMSSIDFRKGKLVIAYREDNANSTLPRVRKTLTLNLGGNSINLLNNDLSTAPNYVAALNSANTTIGDNSLYLKGGDGSIAVVEPFGPTPTTGSEIPVKLEELKAKNWLINEAYLQFYIDRDAMDLNIHEPLRVYLYDLDGSKPIFDYYGDGSTNSSYPKLNKYYFSGIIEKKDSKGYKCKVRISQYLKAILTKSDADLKGKKFQLGIAVTENINNVLNAHISESSPAYNADFKFLPVSSVLSPLGTVFYGSAYGTAPNEVVKRPKLVIYYTKPD